MTYPETLFAEHLDWAQNVGRRYARSKGQGAFETEEAIAAATEGLFHAAKVFDPQHENHHAEHPFKRFAYYRVAGSVRDYFRQRDEFRRRRKVRPRFVEFLPEHHKQLRDNRSEAAKLEREGIEFIHYMVDRHISGAPQKVLKLVMRGFTQVEIGKVMGVSESRVCQIIRTAREALRRAMRREE